MIKIARTRFSKVQFIAALLLIGMVLSGCDLRLNPSSLPVSVVNLPFDQSNISFDDISFDARMERVIVPAAETGMLALIDPVTQNIQLIQGFSKQTDPANPAIGTTSAVTARGMIFALDRTAKIIQVIDPGAGRIVSSAPLQDAPDYIRYVSATNELWVTERALQQIEVFPLDTQQPPNIGNPTVISVPNGPEALLIDRTRGLAFTNQPKIGTTAVIQVMTHHIIYEWGNGCSKARGMAIDEERGYLFVVCGEGKLVMMDINNNGLQITSQNYGGGLDFVAYNPTLKHVYLPSGNSAVVAIFQMIETPIPTPTPGLPQPTAISVVGSEDVLATPIPGPKVSLVRVGTADTALKARCITTDNHNNIWICDPNHAQLFLIHDTFPPGS
jgi:hypothetical protein